MAAASSAIRDGCGGDGGEEDKISISESGSCLTKTSSDPAGGEGDDGSTVCISTLKRSSSVPVLAGRDWREEERGWGPT